MKDGQDNPLKQAGNLDTFVFLRVCLPKRLRKMDQFEEMFCFELNIMG
ncbi:hypothetical protein LRHMDP2_1841 [Lacticaseibacillus rhamnosus LRHMDP2]|uniref:Transposase n=1 Tax=Lacticaseibacillus rhamnosus LRHMDP3 TaxID=1203259 RepID=A0AB33XX80_LACRH|nr:hypothetical protein LRHMDP2_1841 [Lacticaseibacillus rhamnosus LRHMDP2]EKS52334.1 hypothetical protein LRHMDP3_705 [Lacticaseibacillus rhamnosus LRHMDP3]